MHLCPRLRRDCDKVSKKNLVSLIEYRDDIAALPLSRILFRASVGLLLLASYLPVFTLYARQHWSVLNLQGAYAHAPLSVLLIAFLVWRQRSHLSEPRSGLPIAGGSVFLGLGVILKVYGDVQGYVVLQGISLIPVLLGLLQIHYGANTVRAMRFPLLFLFFIIPLPGAAIDWITVPLVEITAELVVSILPLFDIAIMQAGHVLTVNALDLAEYHEIILSPECSGIRSLVSMIALSSLFAHLQGRRRAHTVMLMLMTIPLVILGNFIRVTSTVLMIVYVSPETAQNFFHWSSGLVLFSVTLVGMFIADALLLQSKIGKVSAYD